MPPQAHKAGAAAFRRLLPVCSLAVLSVEAICVASHFTVGGMSLSAHGEGGSAVSWPPVIPRAASSMLVLFTQVLCGSQNTILRECFLVAELENRRRPPTVSERALRSWCGLARGQKSQGTVTIRYLPL